MILVKENILNLWTFLFLEYYSIVVLSCLLHPQVIFLLFHLFIRLNLAREGRLKCSEDKAIHTCSLSFDFDFYSFFFSSKLSIIF